MLDPLPEPREGRRQILAKRAGHEPLGYPEPGIEVHLVLDDGRRSVGGRLEEPGAVLLLEVPADAVEVDALRRNAVSPQHVAHAGQDPRIVDLLLDLLPAPVRGAVDPAAELQTRNELQGLPTVDQ